MAELIPCPNPSCTNWNPAGRPKCFKCGTKLDKDIVEREDPGAHSRFRALVILLIAGAVLGGGAYFLHWREIRSDKIAPVVTITEPQSLTQGDQLRSNAPKATIKGKVEDPHADRVEAGGKSAPVTDGLFTISVDVGEEGTDVSLVAVDKAGNRSAPKTFRVERDSTSPEFVTLDPADGGFAVASPLTVSGEATEELGAVVAGTTPGSVVGTTFSVSGVSLVGGDNEIKVKISDLAGNETTRTIRVRYEARELPEGVTASEGGFVSSKDGSRLVLVPEGEFTMGTDRGDADERPAHAVKLSAFLIDATPVTFAQYQKFVDETGGSMPPAPDFPVQPDLPVVNVTFEEAQAYAKWAGRSLPSEAQWEKAARGTDGRLYPWGDDPPTPDSKRANIEGAGDGFAAAAPVGSFPDGRSPYGALDMAGNVWQWTFDWYDPKYYASVAPGAENPEGPPSGAALGNQIAVRGGAFTSKPADVRSTNRYPRVATDRGRNIGFRTVIEL